MVAAQAILTWTTGKQDWKAWVQEGKLGKAKKTLTLSPDLKAKVDAEIALIIADRQKRNTANVTVP